MIKLCLAGEGAQGETYMQEIQHMDDVKVISLVGGIEEDTQAFAERWNIPFYTMDLAEGMGQEGVDAVILGTPSALHAEHARLAFSMGKHQLLEIPMALNLADCQELVLLESQHNLKCMVAHTRRYSPICLEIERRVKNGELTPYHVLTETHFFRRENLNRFGQPRTWVDSLLWHHACHYIDQIQAWFEPQQWEAWAQAGPNHKELGIPMDISFCMKNQAGVIVTSSYSFNEHGPFGGHMKVIGEQDTLLMQRPNLLDHNGNILATDQPGDPFKGILREFVESITEDHEPRTSYAKSLYAMEIIDRAQHILDET